MPQLKWSQSVAAAGTFTPISASVPPWQYEFLPWPAECIVLQRATGSGFTETIFTGSETIAQVQPIQAGGTAGVTPSPLNTTPLTFFGSAGDRLMIVDNNTSAGALTVDGIFLVNP
jgi:hypothetical protein